MEMSEIVGVSRVRLLTHSDDRGHLTEIYRTDQPYHAELARRGLQINQVYIVEDQARGTIRAFHKHRELWDIFFISRGSAKFILVDDRDESTSYKSQMTLVAGDKDRTLIIVPPGVFHGWMSLEDDTQLVSIASHTYDAKAPDEARVPYDSFGVRWDVAHR